MKVHLYNKAEREAAEATFEKEQDDWKLKRAAERSLPTRKARVKAFQRTGKVPTGFMVSRASVAWTGHRMTDAEASRVVLPKFPPPYIPSRHEQPAEDRVLEPGVEVRYLMAIGVKQTGEEKGRMVFHCGCSIGRGYSRAYVTACEGHRGPLTGRDEETGEYL